MTWVFWFNAWDLLIEVPPKHKLWAEVSWRDVCEANLLIWEVKKVEESLRFEPSGRWSVLGQISSPNFYKFFLKKVCKEKIWENTLIRHLTRLALSSRISVLMQAFLCLAMSFLLLLSAPAFPKVKYLEALVDLKMVGAIILEMLCFKVMHQKLSFFHILMILKFCYEFDPLSALVWLHVADTPRAYVINISLLLDLKLRRWAVLFCWVFLATAAGKLVSYPSRLHFK